MFRNLTVSNNADILIDWKTFSVKVFNRFLQLLFSCIHYWISHLKKNQCIQETEKYQMKVSVQLWKYMDAFPFIFYSVFTTYNSGLSWLFILLNTIFVSLFTQYCVEKCSLVFILKLIQAVADLCLNFVFVPKLRYDIVYGKTLSYLLLEQTLPLSFLLNVFPKLIDKNYFLEHTQYKLWPWVLYFWIRGAVLDMFLKLKEFFIRNVTHISYQSSSDSVSYSLLP